MPRNNQNSNTGSGNLVGAAQSAATNLAGPALDLASGASAMQAASNALRGAALDKLLGPTALLAGGLVGVLRTMKAIVDQSGILERGIRRIASMQQIQGKFETLLKSAEAATARMKELYRFDASSHIALSDIAEVNRILQALTRGAMAGAEGMKMVGDAAAATGQSFSETATQFGKLNAALRSGRSLDRVLFQLQMSGAVTDRLARQLETAEQAGADFGAMWSIVTKEMAMNEGGMKNEMKTLGGLTKQLATASAMMETAFAEPFVEAQARAMENTVNATKNLTPLLAKIATESAPILQVFTNVKNSLVDATLATKGFASGLGMAWNVAKTLAVGVAAAAGANAIGSLGRGAAHVRGTRNMFRAGKAGVAHQAGVASAAALGAESSAAFAEGALGTGVALKAQSLWVRASTSALTLHSAALVVAGHSTAKFSILSYAASVATGVLGGALTLLRTIIAKVGGSVLISLANPLVLFTTAVAGATLALKAHFDSVAKANQEYIDLVQNSAKVTKALREQVAAVKDLDQYRAAGVKLGDEEKAVVERMKARGARPAAMVRTIGYDGMTGQVESVSDDSAGQGYDEARRVDNETLSRIRAQRKKLAAINLSTLGPSQDQKASYTFTAAAARQLRDSMEQSGIDQADDPERARLLRLRAARLSREAMIGGTIEEGRLFKEKFANNPTELMRVSGQIANAEATRGGASPSLYRQQADLVNLGETHREKSAAALADRDQADALERQIAVSRVILDFDEQIAAVRKAGGQAGVIEAAKELAILEKQLAIARAKGKAGAEEARRIEADIALTEAARAGGRAGKAVGRAVDNAYINGKPKAAQAIIDADARNRMREEYARIGLGQGAADSDFNARILAEAAQKEPRIVADSLQSIGGGGGSGGSDPMLAAQQRLLAINEAQRALLTIIANAAANDSGTRW